MCERTIREQLKELSAQTCADHDAYKILSERIDKIPYEEVVKLFDQLKSAAPSEIPSPV